MGRYLDELIGVGTPALVSTEASLGAIPRKPAGSLAGELGELLRKKNGFYAFESALHVFPAQSASDEIGLLDWNSPELWIREYHGMADGCFFFAEDAFGGQFTIKGDKIYQFAPETAELEFLADDLEGWAEAILSQYNLLTGYPLAHEWQEANGPIPRNSRLVPKLPFVAGGEFSIRNLYALERVKAMSFRATIAVQIRDLPDGTPINFKVVD